MKYPKKNVLSFGGGIQSTALALMFIQNDLDMPHPDAVIFADTGWERESTYAHVRSFSKLVEKSGIPFVVVSGGNLLEVLLNPDNPRPEVPAFVNASRYETIDGLRELLISDTKKQYRKLKKEASATGQSELFDLPSLESLIEMALVDFERKVASGEIKAGWKEMKTSMLGRQCTLRLKIRPIKKWIRNNLDPTADDPVGQYIGISLDEWHRMTTDKDERFKLVYPLVRERITREDCEQYILDSKYPLPSKSACIGCPYHSNETWRTLNESEEENAMHVEQTLNHLIKNSKLADRPYFANGVRFHPSMKPLWERPYNGDSEVLNAYERDGVCGAAGCFL